LSIDEGLQVPLMPLLEVPGKLATASPAQYSSVLPKSKTGSITGLTVTVNVAGLAQALAFGVKVYVPLFMLSTVAGLQVPENPFCDIDGSVGTVAPAQILLLVPKLKVGVCLGLTVTNIVVGRPHCPALGVNL